MEFRKLYLIKTNFSSILEKIKNILVPLDGSFTSQKGFKLALTLAKSLNAKITAINVIRFSNGFQFPVSSEIKQIHAKSAEKIISDAQKIAKKEKIPFIGKKDRFDNYWFKRTLSRFRNISWKCCKLCVAQNKHTNYNCKIN